MTQPLPNQTTTGRNHPSTSHEAAETVYVHTGTDRYKVLALLAHGNLTDDEIQLVLNMSANTQRPRRHELVLTGLVTRSSVRRKTAAGRWAIAWTITDKGREALARVTHYVPPAPGH